MLSLAERVYRAIQRHRLLPPGARLVVALSGGADSTALACLLVELAPRGGFQVVGAAHLNHRLRGAASDEDENFCRKLAGRLGLEWRSETVDVTSFAVRERASIEDAGRRCRYDFLHRAAAELHATHLAVGHTRDDQAETLLLHMLRGAGPRGLRGMLARRPLGPPPEGAGESVCLVRPLLDVTHGELVEWLEARSIAFREDASNRDVRFLRNRIRHEVIPFLQDRVSKSVSRVLARDARLAAADAECLEALAASAFARLALVGPDRVELDRPGLCTEAPAVARRVALLAAANLSGRRFVGFDQGERLLALALGHVPGPLALPGVTAEVSASKLLLSRREGRGGKQAGGPGMNFWRCALSIPGEVRLPGCREGAVSSCLRSWPDEGIQLRSPNGTQAVVDAARVAGLAVRHRRHGDWLQPLGLGGRKKLQDYFVDRKVPRRERDRVPLVVDGRDRIVWVVGHGIDDEFRVSGVTRDVVILKLRGESA